MKKQWFLMAAYHSGSSATLAKHYHYARDCQKVDAKHQNQKAPIIKKGFNCKKTGFVLTLHTHKMSAW